MVVNKLARTAALVGVTLLAPGSAHADPPQFPDLRGCTEPQCMASPPLATRLLTAATAVVCMSCAAAPRHAAAQPPGFPDLSGFAPVPVENYFVSPKRGCVTPTFRLPTTSIVPLPPPSLCRRGMGKPSNATVNFPGSTTDPAS
jgi:hypothetical protein